MDSVHIFDTSVDNSIDWVHDNQEGQLAVDVLETKQDVVVVAPMGGAVADRIEVYANNDVLTIRGERVSPTEKGNTMFHQECFWGVFSRTVVLPVDVKGDLAQATYKNGVLVVRLPKRHAHAKIAVEVVDE